MIQTEKTIGIIPIGNVPDLAPKVIAAHIPTYFKFSAEILPRLENPLFAYDKKRLQYDAGIILSSFRTAGFDNFEKFIGVCDLDLFIPIFAHVYGEAQQDGDYALVSIFRLQEKGSSPDANPNIYERLSKIAIHEIGHLFRMIHCEDELCLMHYSGDIHHLDKIRMHFCRYCVESVKNHLV